MEWVTKKVEDTGYGSQQETKYLHLPLSVVCNRLIVRVLRHRSRLPQQ